MQTRNQYSDYLIDPSFQGVDRPFLLLFENDTHHSSYMRYFFQAIETKYYNVMIDGRTFLISQYKIIKEHMITTEKL